MPLIPCSVAQAVTKSLARAADEYFWHGVLQRNTLLWPCGTTTNRYSADTLRDANLNTTVGRELRTHTYPDFGRHLEPDASASSVCCTPWVSRAIRRPNGRDVVGNCANAFVYDFELDIIEEGFRMLRSTSSDGDVAKTRALTIDHVTLEKSDAVSAEALRSKIGADVGAQVIFIENIESLYWDEFKLISDADEVKTWRDTDCRVGPE